MNDWNPDDPELRVPLSILDEDPDECSRCHQPLEEHPKPWRYTIAERCPGCGKTIGLQTGDIAEARAVLDAWVRLHRERGHIAGDFLAAIEILALCPDLTPFQP